MELPKGLRQTIRGLLTQVEQRSGIRCQTEFNIEGEVPMPVVPVAYRILLSAITNAERHAKPTTLCVTLATERNGLRATVRDDGVGFDLKSHVQARGHIGLASMRERAVLAGGWLEIRTAPGEGTMIDFWIPYDLPE